EKPKNRLTDEGIAAVSDAFHGWRECEKLSRVLTLDRVRDADYNLSPSAFIESSNRITLRPLQTITAELIDARAAREKADLELDELLLALGLSADRGGNAQ